MYILFYNLEVRAVVTDFTSKAHASAKFEMKVWETSMLLQVTYKNENVIDRNIKNI